MCEEEKNYWVCPMCGRELPLSNGAADDFGDVCDECAALLAELRDQFPHAPLSLTPKENLFEDCEDYEDYKKQRLVELREAYGLTDEEFIKGWTADTLDPEGGPDYAAWLVLLDRGDLLS
jgi:hypothetical protein